MCVATSLAACCLLSGSVWAAEGDGALRWQREEGVSLTLMRGQDVVWRFNFGPKLTKPFFHPLALPSGEVLTSQSPPDHPWHYGLWFSWKYINGVNYWEEDRRTGRAAGLTRWSDVKLTARDDHSARIEMTLDYHPPGKPTVLTEQRSIEVGAPTPDGSYRIDWTSTFTAQQDAKLDRTPPPGEPGGQGWGGYAGLSLRLVNFQQRAAVSANGPVAFDDQQRARYHATATDYHGLIGPRPVGIAVCDHPANLNAPTPWYVIRSDQMTYFSPAVICYRPHAVHPRESFTLRYRVVVHPGAWTREQLTAEAEDFAASGAPIPETEARP
jgi:Family of unknown function (DUF6807)